MSKFFDTLAAGVLAGLLALAANPAPVRASFGGTGALPAAGGGTASTTGQLHLPANSTAAGSAPLYTSSSGSLMTSPEAGALETLNRSLRYTQVSTRESLFTGLWVTSTVDPPSIASYAVWESGDIAMSGAALQDCVIVGAPSTIEAGLVWCAFVTTTGNVHLRIANITAGAIDPASAVWSIADQH